VPLVTLSLDSAIRDIDPKVASRRTGLRAKGPAGLGGAQPTASASRPSASCCATTPRRYIDRSTTASIRDLRIGQDVTVIGRVRRVTKRLTRRRQAMVTISLYDGTGYLELTFFNQPWVERQYAEGTELAVSGKVATYRGRLQLQNQEVEVLRDLEAETVHVGRITPVHAATEGVTSRTVRELVWRALERLPAIGEPIPFEIVSSEGLAPEDAALRDIHFPPDPEALARATERLKFDELFTLELGVAYRKRRVERQARGVAHRLDAGLADDFVAGLPFTLTGSQRRAIAEVAADLASNRPMHRLLQGEVGSGKTVVALYAALVAVQSGHQATLMAPDRGPGRQHHRTATALLEAIGGRDLLSVPAAKGAPPGRRGAGEPPRRGRPDDDEAGRTDVRPASPHPSLERTGSACWPASGTAPSSLLIGTHALVQEGVEFADLSVAVIDEQHRFGVHQRIQLKEKGGSPDVLIMTATPIPRTLASRTTATSTCPCSTSCPPGGSRSRPGWPATPSTASAPISSCGRRSPRGGRPSWSARRSTRATASR
jgi:ATP-dependent DNA helicase RecG